MIINNYNMSKIVIDKNNNTIEPYYELTVELFCKLDKKAEFKRLKYPKTSLDNVDELEKFMTFIKMLYKSFYCCQTLSHLEIVSDFNNQFSFGEMNTIRINSKILENPENKNLKYDAISIFYNTDGSGLAIIKPDITNFMITSLKLSFFNETLVKYDAYFEFSENDISEICQEIEKSKFKYGECYSLHEKDPKIFSELSFKN